jgi:prepilin-type N-terminal cleavage/methylation domain-containing protein
MHQSARSIQGFTLVEVLISILITTVFVSVSLQGVLAAILLQSKAARQAEANNWIQSDLAEVRWQASRAQLAFDKNRCQVTNADQGFADALRDRLAQTDVTGTTSYTAPVQLKRSTTGQEFELARTFSITDSPYQILGIQYQVRPHTSEAAAVANFYSEVIADATFQCE